jgi:biopolymer transport protein TolR
MGQIEGGGGGRGRQVNLELNLVPFIDLMSVLITFLLIAAVWTQVSMLQIGSSLYGKKSEEQPAPEPTPMSDIVLKVDVKAEGFILTIGTQVFSLPRLQEGYDKEGLRAQLVRVKETYPEKIDSIVAVSDELPYELLIIVMDQLRKAGFPAISVATGGPA